MKSSRRNSQHSQPLRVIEEGERDDVLDSTFMLKRSPNLQERAAKKRSPILLSNAIPNDHLHDTRFILHGHEGGVLRGAGGLPQRDEFGEAKLPRHYPIAVLRQPTGCDGEADDRGIGRQRGDAVTARHS
jgi:hypothetical protein